MTFQSDLNSAVKDINEAIKKRGHRDLLHVPEKVMNDFQKTVGKSGNVEAAAKALDAALKDKAPTVAAMAKAGMTFQGEYKKYLSLLEKAAPKDKDASYDREIASFEKACETILSAYTSSQSGVLRTVKRKFEDVFGDYLPQLISAPLAGKKSVAWFMTEKKLELKESAVEDEPCRGAPPALKHFKANIEYYAKACAAVKKNAGVLCTDSQAAVYAKQLVVDIYNTIDGQNGAIADVDDWVKAQDETWLSGDYVQTSGYRDKLAVLYKDLGEERDRLKKLGAAMLRMGK